ncbi:hypothetical protein SDC9_07611 [bioreactor metagenome]|uniref:Uncharacterized protein n=1 Tax=bioreactor metagenome TaxID=1076179 RepID=A0A644T7X5_9ZZZZ|nr:hypothetical protein [Methanobrevibacter sp.]MEA4957732.1 hypothetical protein [Methanobrevibacter sp.]
MFDSNSNHFKNKESFNFLDRFTSDKLFNKIINLIVFSYLGLVENEIIYKKSDIKYPKRENFFTRKLVDEMEKHQENQGLGHLVFNCEVQEANNDFSLVGLLDIKIQIIERERISDIYYSIECKRLDTGSNDSKYISEGVFDFISGKYSSNNNTAGMISFIERGNILNIIEKINERLLNNEKINTLKDLNKISLEIDLKDDFEHIYYSKHKRTNDLSDINIYHIMLDYTQIYVNN